MRLRFISVLFILPLIIFGSASCGTAEGELENSASGATTTVEHNKGKTEVPLNPERVVVTDLSILQSLTDLGLPDAVGVPQLTNWPASLQRYSQSNITQVGGLKEPDFEAIAALNPDLILIAARTSNQYDKFAEIAPTVDLTVDNNNFYQSFTERTLTLASIYGAQEKAQQELDSLNKYKDKITRIAQTSKQRGLILMTSGAKITGFGPGSRFGFIHELGIQPIKDDFAQDTHGDAVSFEFVKEFNPDQLFVLDRDAEIGDMNGPHAGPVLNNELVNATNAAKNHEIHYMDLYTWYLAPSAPSSVRDGIALVERALAP